MSKEKGEGETGNGKDGGSSGAHFMEYRKLSRWFAVATCGGEGGGLRRIQSSITVRQCKKNIV